MAAWLNGKTGRAAANLGRSEANDADDASVPLIIQRGTQVYQTSRIKMKSSHTPHPIVLVLFVQRCMKKMTKMLHGAKLLSRSWSSTQAWWRLGPFKGGLVPSVQASVFTHTYRCTNTHREGPAGCLQTTG